ncbi:MAG TPA: hypothetical protein IAD07_07970 [Candidatus Fimivicinus intestinavium]|nr:hypothetical protein [Candidatus Fimivicinus intestinavium]
MHKITNKHVGVFSFIGNNIVMFLFTLAFGALITSRGIDLSAVTPTKIFFSAMYLGLVFVVSSVCGYHNNHGGLIALLLVSFYPIIGTIGSTLAVQAGVSLSGVAIPFYFVFLLGSTPLMPVMAAANLTRFYGMELLAVFLAQSLLIVAVWLAARAWRKMKQKLGIDEKADNAMKV